MFEMLIAREIYEQSRSVFRLVGERRGEGRTLYLVGTTYEWSGEKQQALDTYWQARSLLQSAGDPMGEALTLYNIAEVDRSWGELQKAVDYYAQGFAIQDIAERESGKPFHNPGCYREIGDPGPPGAQASLPAGECSALAVIHQKPLGVETYSR